MGDISKAALEAKHPAHCGRVHALKNTVAGNNHIAAP